MPTRYWNSHRLPRATKTAVQVPHATQSERSEARWTLMTTKPLCPDDSDERAHRADPRDRESENRQRFLQPGWVARQDRPTPEPLPMPRLSAWSPYPGDGSRLCSFCCYPAPYSVSATRTPLTSRRQSRPLLSLNSNDPM